MAAKKDLVVTFSTSTNSTPPSNPSEFAHIPTPIIPRDGSDFFLYIILDSSPQSTGISTINISTFTTAKCEVPTLTAPFALRRSFAALSIDVRETWNRFVAEMQGRGELKERVIVVRMLDTSDGKVFFRVCGVDRAS